MLSDGLIADAGMKYGDDVNDERRRYFKLSPLGHEAARLEARRLHELLSDSRAKRLLSARR